MTLVIDDTFLVDVRNGRTEALELLDDLISAAVPMVVPTVVLPAVLARSSDPDGDEDRIAAAAQVMPLTLAQAREAAGVVRYDRGRAPRADPISALVEGVALEQGHLPVVTRCPDRYGRLDTRSY